MSQQLHRQHFVPVACCALIVCVITVVTLVSVGCRGSKKYSSTLMPTPLGLSLGAAHPGGSFEKSLNDRDFPVFIVSGRNIEEDARGLDPFGTERNRQAVLGIARVAIGEGLSPDEIFQQTIQDMRKKTARVRLVDTQITGTPEINPWLMNDDIVRHQGNPWVQQLRRELDQSQSRRICIFVHGYNTQYVDNTLLAAEIFHYLGRDGAMLSFEWPSEAKILRYIADKGNATYSTRHFRGLIANLAKETGAESITIIAHSAGCPIVVNALRELRLQKYDCSCERVLSQYRVSRVALAAPDMDVMAFINAVHDRFYEMADGVAVYASPEDNALLAAKFLYKSDRLGRSVGQLDPWEKTALSSVSRLEMIDASKPDKDHRKFLGHSYFHRDPWISSDIACFLMGVQPQRRGLTREPKEVFWEFPDDFEDRLRKELGQAIDSAGRISSGLMWWKKAFRRSPGNTGRPRLRLPSSD